MRLIKRLTRILLPAAALGFLIAWSAARDGAVQAVPSPSPEPMSTLPGPAITVVTATATDAPVRRPVSLPTPTLRTMAEGEEPVDGAAEPSGASVRVIYSSINVRFGPGLAYDPVAYLFEDDVVTAVGIHPQSGWLRVDWKDGRLGWVAPTVVEHVGDWSASQLEEMFAPPTPTPTPSE